ncbi:MAG TPA: hypothetical protein VFU97_13395, partial [Xanthobacteraceae bacterium]|nr:hypothetical protein [Xanthobacteraceae bacterium]
MDSKFRCEQRIFKLTLNRFPITISPTERRDRLPQQSERPPLLRLIQCADDTASAAVTSLPEAAARRAAVDELRSYARDFEARNGKCAYSDYILKHGCLP